MPGGVRGDLGKVWGRQAKETEALKQALDSAKVQEYHAQGFTKDLAEYWRRFYANELVRNPSNEAAAARVEFLKKFLELAK